jgi:hypothetical protein
MDPETSARPGSNDSLTTDYHPPQSAALYDSSPTAGSSFSYVATLFSFFFFFLSSWKAKGHLQALTATLFYSQHVWVSRARGQHEELGVWG